jgi:hypothetical protein
MKMADRPKNRDRTTVRPSVIRLLNDFIPQGTEFVPELGMSVDYVKLGENP